MGLNIDWCKWGWHSWWKTGYYERQCQQCDKKQVRMTIQRPSHLDQNDITFRWVDAD